MEKVSGLSKDIELTEKEKLQSVFPQCFSDGKLDIDKLLNLCGEYIENDFEKYKFEWAGKSECYKIAGKRSTGTLRPCREESVNFDTTKNLYIEGDNLEVLKLLQNSYYGKVKMIYIDPPYNTGNDFVYEDDFKDPIEKYKEITQQTTKSNPETMGRFHTNWLNMMYPRLRLAANLLRDDGVIFISIDDNEVTNLRKLCDEVFGEENFVAQLIWERAYSPKNDAKYISNSHDYVLMYAKKLEDFKIGRLPRTEEANARYSNPDNDPRGDWKSTDMSVKTFSESGNYPITTPTGNVVYPPAGRCWSLSRSTFEEKLKDNRISFGANGDGTPRIKTFLSELKYDGMSPTSILFYKDVCHSQEGRQELKKLFDDKGYFDGPKPIRLLNRLLTLANVQNDDIILDFFSGSATTAHAVMQLNAEDSGNRQFICVQLPELCNEKSEAYKAGYKNICEIGKERIRRAGKKILDCRTNARNDTTTRHYEERSDEVIQKCLNLDCHSDKPARNDDLDCLEMPDGISRNDGIDCRANAHNDQLDIGFKVLKLDTSNLAQWDSTPTEEQGALFARLHEIENSVKSDRTDLDVVYEVMLKLGVPLDFLVQEIQINNKKAYSIGENCLVLVCIDYGKDGITPEDVEKMCEYLPAKIVSTQQAFKDDVALSNAHYILKDRDIEIKLL